MDEVQLLTGDYERHRAMHATSKCCTGVALTTLMTAAWHRMIYMDDLQVAPETVVSQLRSADFLVAKMVTRRGRLNIAAVYRPSTSSKYSTPSRFECSAKISPFCTTN